MVVGALHDPFHTIHMGVTAENIAAKWGITRQEQDAWGARSHRRAHDAWVSGRLASEVVPVSVPQRKGDPVLFTQDEGIRPDTTIEALAGLPPAFTAEGTVTAGNASQISDGGAAVVVMSERKAVELGMRPLAEIVAFGMSADRYPTLQTVPALAMRKALKRADLEPADLELVEINEAFAAVPLHSARMLGVSEDVVNVNGGAVAMGHPIGASGARRCHRRADPRDAGARDAAPRGGDRRRGGLWRWRSRRRADPASALRPVLSPRP